MKVITFANQKGGVGKSAVATQLAFYAAIKQDQRVLFIDLDHQMNSTNALLRAGYGTEYKATSLDVMSDALDYEATEAEQNIVVVAGSKFLMKLEREAFRNECASYLAHFLEEASEDFDLCIIDTNPTPDVRQIAALMLSDYVLAPIQLNQESIDGIGDLLNHPTVGLKNIKAKLNPSLEFLGVLPNIVEHTRFQQDNLKAFFLSYGDIMFKLAKSKPAIIKKSTAMAEAQAGSMPVWDIGKQSARNLYKLLAPVFDALLKKMEVI